MEVVIQIDDPKEAVLKIEGTSIYRTRQQPAREIGRRPPGQRKPGRNHRMHNGTTAPPRLQESTMLSELLPRAASIADGPAYRINE